MNETAVKVTSTKPKIESHLCSGSQTSQSQSPGIEDKLWTDLLASWTDLRQNTPKRAPYRCVVASAKHDASIRVKNARRSLQSLRSVSFYTKGPLKASMPSAALRSPKVRSVSRPMKKIFRASWKSCVGMCRARIAHSYIDINWSTNPCSQNSHHWQKNLQSRHAWPSRKMPPAQRTHRCSQASPSSQGRSGQHPSGRSRRHP